MVVSPAPRRVTSAKKVTAAPMRTHAGPAATRVRPATPGGTPKAVPLPTPLRRTPSTGNMGKSKAFDGPLTKFGIGGGTAVAAAASGTRAVVARSPRAPMAVRSPSATKVATAKASGDVATKKRAASPSVNLINERRATGGASTKSRVVTRASASATQNKPKKKTAGQGEAAAEVKKSAALKKKQPASALENVQVQKRASGRLSNAPSSASANAAKGKKKTKAKDHVDPLKNLASELPASPVSSISDANISSPRFGQFTSTFGSGRVPFRGRGRAKPVRHAAPSIVHDGHKLWNTPFDGYLIVIQFDGLLSEQPLPPLLQEHCIICTDEDVHIASEFRRACRCHGVIFNQRDWFVEVEVDEGSAYARYGPFRSIDQKEEFKNVLIIEPAINAAKGYRDNTILFDVQVAEEFAEHTMGTLERVVEELLDSGLDVPTFIKTSKQVAFEPRDLIVNSCDKDQQLLIATVRPCPPPDAVDWQRSGSFAAAFAGSPRPSFDGNSSRPSFCDGGSPSRSPPNYDDLRFRSRGSLNIVSFDDEEEVEVEL